ncbi:hypothetical protein C5C42_10530 [Rathayibacter sp. AY1F7]|nr:hypothetical protein C5C25_13640 [Rathayibacter sp. AY2B9]PPH45019.1 hypothetical protein C5C42_10530 [Rathayibacter sp. AY1F7]PPI04514.1 hypothetical protein C5C63_15595 [Rathayibacter sp. AY1B8]
MCGTSSEAQGECGLEARGSGLQMPKDVPGLGGSAVTSISAGGKEQPLPRRRSPRRRSVA